MDQNNSSFFFTYGEIKSLEQFTTIIKNAILSEYPDYCIEIKKTLKNNDHELIGISISEPGKECNPTIYLESYYKSYQNGVSLDDIRRHIIHSCKNYTSLIDISTIRLSDYSSAKDKIQIQLVNRKHNARRLSNMPFIPFLDLAVIFSVILSEDENGIGQVHVTNDIFSSWKNITVKDLLFHAMDNTQTNHPVCFRKITDLMLELIISHPNNIIFPEIFMFLAQESIIEREPIYVLTNEQKYNGANVILYNGILDFISETLEEDFYILPSSIHETIIIPVSFCDDAQALIAMVNEINKKYVDYEDFLSNHIYYYESILRKIHLY